MTSEAALDQLALVVGFRMMGPDAFRRLRISLLRDPATGTHGYDLERLERIEALATGVRLPETLQDHLDLKAAEQARYQPPFEPGFWMQRVADLVTAGFDEVRAQQVVAEVQARVTQSQQTEGAGECLEA